MKNEKKKRKDNVNYEAIKDAIEYTSHNEVIQELMYRLSKKGD